jgi:hypothetical protein
MPPMARAPRCARVTALQPGGAVFGHRRASRAGRGAIARRSLWIAYIANRTSTAMQVIRSTTVGRVSFVIFSTSSSYKIGGPREVDALPRPAASDARGIASTRKGGRKLNREPAYGLPSSAMAKRDDDKRARRHSAGQALIFQVPHVAPRRRRDSRSARRCMRLDP